MSRKLMGVIVVLFCAGLATADGLDAGYGGKFKDFNHDGKTYKILASGVMPAGASLTVPNVLFETNAKATLISVGPKGNGGDLDLFITETQTGREIGKDTLVDNFPVVSWTTGNNALNRVTIRLVNAGSAATDYVLLANY